MSSICPGVGLNVETEGQGTGVPGRRTADVKTMESMQTRKGNVIKGGRQNTEHKDLDIGTSIQNGNFTNCSNQTTVVARSHLGNNPA